MCGWVGQNAPGTRAIGCGERASGPANRRTCSRLIPRLVAMSTDDDKARRAVEAWLRRPGELFEDEWAGYQPRHDGPAISPIWWMDPRDDAPNEAYELDDEMARAWDLLCDNPAFRAWFEENEAALSGGDTGNFLTVRDGGSETLRFSRTGNLTMTVPVETLRASQNVVLELQRVIIAILGRRADREGAPPPPIPSTPPEGTIAP